MPVSPSSQSLVSKLILLPALPDRLYPLESYSSATGEAIQGAHDAISLSVSKTMTYDSTKIEATTMIDYYQKNWQIVVLFCLLKTDRQIEEQQFGCIDTYERALLL